jgi:hypothetical protein
MQQTTERPTARRGLLRRLRLRGESAPAASQPAPPETATETSTVIDLRDDVPAAQWRLAVAERLERLEEGMALVVETMKRAFSQVYGSIEDLRAERAGPSEQLERILQESVASLKIAVEELSESIHRVPYVLAAAADDITAKLDTPTSGTGPDAGPAPTALPDRDHGGPAEVMPATPFELEPVEDQFVPMEEDDDDRVHARQIWGMEA